MFLGWMISQRIPWNLTWLPIIVLPGLPGKVSLYRYDSSMLEMKNVSPMSGSTLFTVMASGKFADETHCMPGGSASLSYPWSWRHRNRLWLTLTGRGPVRGSGRGHNRLRGHHHRRRQQFHYRWPAHSIPWLQNGSRW